MAARLDSIQWSTAAYGKERHEKPPKEFTHKKPEYKPKKKFNNDGNSTKTKDQRKKEVPFTCGGERHMAKDCPNKKDKGKAKVKKEVTSNLATELSGYDEVYINTLEFASCTAAQMTHPTTIKVYHAHAGTMFIN